jgi:hypothetical protein
VFELRIIACLTAVGLIWLVLAGIIYGGVLLLQALFGA